MSKHDGPDKMRNDEIDRLASMGSITEEQLAIAENAGRIDLTLTALAIAIRTMKRVPLERQADLKAMRLLFHELAGDDADIWEERAEYLVAGAVAKR